jgi:hypothetical protein
LASIWFWQECVTLILNCRSTVSSYLFQICSVYFCVCAHHFYYWPPCTSIYREKCFSLWVLRWPMSPMWARKVLGQWGQNMFTSDKGLVAWPLRACLYCSVTSWMPHMALFLYECTYARLFSPLQQLSVYQGLCRRHLMTTWGFLLTRTRMVGQCFLVLIVLKFSWAPVN